MATEAARLMLGKAGEWKGAVGVMRTNVPRNIKALQHKERFLRLADGALQFYDKPKDSAPQRQDLVRAIKSKFSSLPDCHFNDAMRWDRYGSTRIQYRFICCMSQQT